MPTRHGVERTASDPSGRKTNDYLASIFGSLNPGAQNTFVNRQLNPAQQAAYAQAQFANMAGRGQSPYSNQLGDLLYSLMGLSGYGGNGGGYGGRGGGGGGGFALPDYGLEYGLERDKIDAANKYNVSSRGNQVGNELLAQLQQNLQTQQAQEGFGIQKHDFLSQNAATGANTTSGAHQDWQDMARQFKELMQNLDYQNKGLQYARAQSQQDYDYATRQNQFDQQGLDIQAGKTGYQNPFTIPNPVPVQRKAV
jgi:hypothetical protein